MGESGRLVVESKKLVAENGRLVSESVGVGGLFKVFRSASMKVILKFLTQLLSYFHRAYTILD